MKKKIITIVVLIIIGALFFYVGNQYDAFGNFSLNSFLSSELDMNNDIRVSNIGLDFNVERGEVYIPFRYVGLKDMNMNLDTISLTKKNGENCSVGELVNIDTSARGEQVSFSSSEDGFVTFICEGFKLGEVLEGDVIIPYMNVQTKIVSRPTGKLKLLID